MQRSEDAAALWFGGLPGLTQQETGSLGLHLRLFRRPCNFRDPAQAGSMQNILHPNTTQPLKNDLFGFGIVCFEATPKGAQSLLLAGLRDPYAGPGIKPVPTACSSMIPALLTVSFPLTPTKSTLFKQRNRAPHSCTLSHCHPLDSFVVP